MWALLWLLSTSPAAAQELAEVDFRVCDAARQAESLAGELTVAVVVHPDGGWGLALPHGLDAPTTRACLESAIAAHPPAAGRERVLRRTLDPLPDPALGELWGRLQEPVARCFAAAIPGSVSEAVSPLRLHRDAEGRLRVEARGRSRFRSAALRCVRAHLPPEMDAGPGALDVDLAIVRERAPRHDGRSGAVCAWGERGHDGATMPEPRACRAGLVCCGGGAWGSDSFCEPVCGPRP